MNLLQWLKHILTPATIVHSIDGQWYYILYGSRRPEHWVSVEAYPGPVPEDKRHNQFDGYIQITKTSGETYHRRVLPFVFWSVKSAHDNARVDKRSDLFCDYMGFGQWQ